MIAADVVRQPAALLEQVVQVDALHVLHHDEQRAALAMEVVDVDDVLVLQLREALRFALEAGHDVLLRGGGGLQRLDRDGAAERVLDRAVTTAIPPEATSSTMRQLPMRSSMVLPQRTGCVRCSDDG